MPLAEELGPCVKGSPVLQMPFLGSLKSCLSSWGEQLGKAPAFYDNVAQFTAALNIEKVIIEGSSYKQLSHKHSHIKGFC